MSHVSHSLFSLLQSYAVRSPSPLRIFPRHDEAIIFEESLCVACVLWGMAKISSLRSWVSCTTCASQASPPQKKENNSLHPLVAVMRFIDTSGVDCDAANVFCFGDPW